MECDRRIIYKIGFATQKNQIINKRRLMDQQQAEIEQLQQQIMEIES